MTRWDQSGECGTATCALKQIHPKDLSTLLQNFHIPQLELNMQMDLGTQGVGNVVCQWGKGQQATDVLVETFARIMGSGTLVACMGEEC